jgi:type I restriction enzyme S subunit
VFGFVMVTLGEICHSISSGKAKEKDNIGEYPVYGSTSIIARTNKFVYNKTNILVARVGANAGYTHLAYGSYDVSDNTLIVDVRSEYNLKYVYYQLVNIGLNRYAKGGGQPLVTAGQIKEIAIPVPLIYKQDCIVTILDRFDALCNDLSSGLPAEIEARQKQYEYYRDKLLNFKKM